jgi:hypothetical protein
MTNEDREMIARGFGLVAATAHFGTKLDMVDLLRAAAQYTEYVLGKTKIDDLITQKTDTEEAKMLAAIFHERDGWVPRFKG